MFFYLLMQPNQIETLHRKVCMPINKDYYIENFYTLIRVPNNSLTSQEFASKYFCLQSDSTHAVYIVWKRRNRVKRFVKLDKKSKAILKPDLVKSNTKNSTKIGFKCQTSTFLSNSIFLSKKIFERKLIRSQLNQSLSNYSLRSASNGTLNGTLSDISSSSLISVSVKSKPIKSKKKSKTSSNHKTIDPSSKHAFEFSFLKKISSKKILSSSLRARNLFKNEIQFKRINKKSEIKPKHLPKDQLFKVIKSRLKSLCSKVHDTNHTSYDSFDNTIDGQILSKVNTSVDLKLDCFDVLSDRMNNKKNDSIIQDYQISNEIDCKQKADEEVPVKRKKISKIFSRLSDQVSSKTNLIRKKDDEFKKMKVEKKNFKNLFKRIRHNLVNLIVGNAKNERKSDKLCS